MVQPGEQNCLHNLSISLAHLLMKTLANFVLFIDQVRMLLLILQWQRDFV